MTINALALQSEIMEMAEQYAEAVKDQDDALEGTFIGALLVGMMVRGALPTVVEDLVNQREDVSLAPSIALLLDTANVLIAAAQTPKPLEAS